MLVSMRTGILEYDHETATWESVRIDFAWLDISLARLKVAA